jgi:hypothetical protein
VAYQKELDKLASLTDSAPVDKVNFIRAYAKARKIGMTQKNILSGWRITGNWPISRTKALRHPEIQEDKRDSSPKPPSPYLGSDDTPKASRQIHDLGKNKTPATRRRYAIIAKGFEAQEQTLAEQTMRISSLEEEVAHLKRGKKRRAIPNPNRRFMSLGEALAKGEPTPEIRDQVEPITIDSESSEEVVSEGEKASVSSVRVESELPQRITRRGRIIKKPKKL